MCSSVFKVKQIEQKNNEAYLQHCLTIGGIIGGRILTSLLKPYWPFLFESIANTKCLVQQSYFQVLLHYILFCF